MSVIRASRALSIKGAEDAKDGSNQAAREASSSSQIVKRGTVLHSVEEQPRSGRAKTAGDRDKKEELRQSMMKLFGGKVKTC